MTENDISYVIRGAGKGWNKADCKQFIGFCIVSTIHPIIQSTNILFANANAIAKLIKIRANPRLPTGHPWHQRSKKQSFLRFDV